MSQIDTKELFRRYSAGERNFAGANLEPFLEAVDLSGADLSGTRMDEFYLARAILRGVNLRN